MNNGIILLVILAVYFTVLLLIGRFSGGKSDDNENFLMREKKLVDNFMMNYDVDYKITDFSDYTEEFFQAMYDETCFKIYLLDIQTDTNSGLNVARRIREEQDDWISIIIIITAFGEYRYEALGTRLYLLDFINKVYDCEDKIRDTLEIAMKHYDNRRKSLRFEYNYIMKNIEFIIQFWIISFL